MSQRIEQKGAKIELGYWAIRGLAQPIRFLLAYAEVPFNDTRYGLRPDGTPVADELKDWQDVRGTLGLAFPNLPYLIDSRGKAEVRVTQSNSVMRYLARSFGLYGDSESDRVMIDILQDEAYDLRNQIVKTAYTPEEGFEKALAEFTATAVPRYLDGFERHLAARGESPHFVGSRISHVDFILYELVWQTSVMVPGSVTRAHRPRLHAFIEAFAKIPSIAAYMARDTYIERPINSESASFK
jgi:glutathione S-transferase